MSLNMGIAFILCLYGLVSSATAFSWDSCGSSSDPVKVVQLEVSQNSSRTLFVTARGKTGINISSPVWGQVVVKKKMIWGWTPVPCLDGIGSCTYNDVCSLSPYKDKCPKIFVDNDLPCTCPVAQGSYAAKKFPISLNILPKWLEKGHYQLKAMLKANNQNLICLDVDITVT